MFLFVCLFLSFSSSFSVSGMTIIRLSRSVSNERKVVLAAFATVPLERGVTTSPITNINNGSNGNNHKKEEKKDGPRVNEWMEQRQSASTRTRALQCQPRVTALVRFPAVAGGRTQKKEMRKT